MVARLGISLSGGIAAIAGAAASDTPVSVPSGLRVEVIEVLLDPRGTEGLTARFRFLAPGIAAPGADPKTALADMDALCADYALPRVLTRTGPRPVQIVVSLSDRPVPFGVDDPDALQLFEAYDIASGTCVPAMF